MVRRFHFRKRQGLLSKIVPLRFRLRIRPLPFGLSVHFIVRGPRRKSANFHQGEKRKMQLLKRGELYGCNRLHRQPGNRLSLRAGSA